VVGCAVLARIADLGIARAWIAGCVVVHVQLPLHGGERGADLVVLIDPDRRGIRRAVQGPRPGGELEARSGSGLEANPLDTTDPPSVEEITTVYCPSTW
jgi:hypothetical protein